MGSFFNQQRREMALHTNQSQLALRSVCVCLPWVRDSVFLTKLMAERSVLTALLPRPSLRPGVQHTQTAGGASSVSPVSLHFFMHSS